MFNPNEEIQVIGVDLGEDATWQDKYKVYTMFTELNKKLTLKNRYNEKCKENIKLKQELLDYEYKKLEEVK